MAIMGKRRFFLSNGEPEYGGAPDVQVIRVPPTYINACHTANRRDAAVQARMRCILCTTSQEANTDLPGIEGFVYPTAVDLQHSSVAGLSDCMTGMCCKSTIIMVSTTGVQYSTYPRTTADLKLFCIVHTSKYDTYI